ncbi:MAG: protein kinase, partial [Longimicrobiales bacterium]
MSDSIARLNAALEGRYRIERELGEGGMATVYLAEQLEPIRREVALKVLKAGMDTERVVTRFEAERQTLAVMEHPSIASVIDAGATAEGRPYFVMELVRGERLTDYADQHRLTIRERVTLFLQVCRAVQHAHQKGVVHRDLKPSNILVTDTDGEALVKVIDFGIARAVEDADDDGTRLTRADEMVGTPAYMSPEQIEGGAGSVDTRSDIYALGVVLYELIAGDLPFESTTYRGFAALAAALVRDPPTPSRRLAQLPDTQETVAGLRRSDVRSLRSELSGDLDWVVLKAMEKEQERRYATANALADELERYLAHEPVMARPPSASYRARKFARRHRAATAFGAAFVLLLAGFGVVQTIQAQRIREARDVADARRAQAEELVDFMLGDLRAKLEPLGRLDVLDDVGEAAVGYFAALPVEEFSDEELLSRSRALYQIGQVRIQEGRATEAKVVLEESLRLVRSLSERDPGDLERLFELCQARYWVGYAAWEGGDLDAAEEQFEGYRVAAERLVALAPENAAYRLEVYFAHSNMGSLMEARGDLEGAVEIYSWGVETIAALVQEHPDSVEWIGELAESHNLLGLAYRKQGRYRESLEEHQEELELKDRILEMAPEHAYWRLRNAIAHTFTGRLQLLTGDLEDALVSYRRATSALDSMVALDPSNAEWHREAASAYRGLGSTLAAQGRN